MTALTTAIADVLALQDESCWLTPPLRRFAGRGHITGHPVTVQMVADRNAIDPFAPLYEVVSSDLRGAVLVIAGAEDCQGATFGQIIARAAKLAGAVGAIVAGGVRDVDLLEGEGLPVWGIQQVTVGAGGALRVQSVGETVRIGQASVAPDDLIVGDDSGLVAVPGDQQADVLAEAMCLGVAEEEVLAALLHDQKLTEAYAAKRWAVSEIRHRLKSRK